MFDGVYVMFDGVYVMFDGVCTCLTFRSMRPDGSTGRYVTSNPSISNALHESSTHLCSYHTHTHTHTHTQLIIIQK